MPEMPADPISPPADSAKEELIDMIQRFLEYVAGISELLPFTVDRQKFRSITTLAALSFAIFIAWKFLRAPPAHQRRSRQSSVAAAVSGARSSSSNSGLTSSEYYSSSAELRPHDRVDELFQTGKRTLEQIIRHRLNEGRKATCQLLGVILEETTPEELQEHATVKSSVRELLLEITKFCDLYLMERILDDESGVGCTNYQSF
ncbi:peroxisome biogenesis protein 22-like [Phalaenopsis equestris]|uniref:peroxisome biogenesis protein 22-like n=1 Tax=Phalaenopsis equestris TaxID=78828 RepID=UPI0009E1D073|nr:peroxisome biogenesis protein 22-like [Phalaenopsis equestris]